jgi:hypothetical protein
MDLEPFLMGLIAVGLGLTAKVIKDGLRDIGDVKIRIADCQHATAESEATTLELEEKARSREVEIIELRKQVKDLEEQERKVVSTVNAKKKAETSQNRTNFKVDLEALKQE